MILLKKSDFLPHAEKFRITKGHENKWELFVEQYGNVLRLLNPTAVKRQYELNSKSYPYLFVLRHYCELKLKSIIHSRNVEVPKSHDFADIFPLIQDVPGELVAAIQKINLDSDGSCYRYFYDKLGEVGPLYGKRESFFSFYENISQMPFNNDFDLKLGIEPPFSKFLEWDFTFHFNEISTSGIFRSSYDEMTRFLLKAVIDGAVNVNDIYLPLLYFIRHSIELVLKEGLMDMVHEQSDEVKKKINRLLNYEHKLSKLFSGYVDLIPETDLGQLPTELSQQYAHYKSQSEKLKESLHMLDSNSRYFKYPFDPAREHLNISDDVLMEIIPVFLEVDGFLTFNIDVLKEYNLVSYSDKEIERMIGYSPDHY